MKRLLKAGAYLVLVGGFVALFGWAYFGGDTVVRSTELMNSMSGRYGDYTYTLNILDGQNEKTATFSPALNGDDTVIGALHELMRVAYDDTLTDNVSPVVETLHEKNYITFSFGGTKTYFQLFKNDKGEVGSIDFWREKE